MVDKINNKLTITILFSIIALIIGSTLAYWTWSSNNLVTVNITTNMGGIGLTLNGGTQTVNGLAPASCTHSTYANRIPITISRYNETGYPATTTLTLKLTSFTWEHAKPSVDDLSNVNVALSSSNSSCINPIASGNLANITVNNTANTGETQNTVVMTWNYVLPASTGTESMPVNETYYLYVWIDPDYTFENTESNQIQDPLQDISLTVTWDAGDLEQQETLKPKLYDYIQTNADTVTTIDFSNTSEDDSTSGIYRLASTSSDTYPVYFYRGAVTNNNVYFANKCWKIVRTTSTGGVKLIYNGENTGTAQAPACNNTGTDSQIGTSWFNANPSPSFVGYMYREVLRFTFDLLTNASGWKYAPDITYSNGVYTLVSKEINNVTYNVEVKNDISGTNLNYHHYTCGSATEITCNEALYIYNIDDTIIYYRILTNGLKIDEVLNQIFTNNNVTSSDIKEYIDDWYSDSTKGNMLEYTQYLEDTPYCNDRSIYSLGAFNPYGGPVTGSTVTRAMFFGPYNRMRLRQPNLSCDNNNAFTVNDKANGNGALTYPVGLITSDEIMIAGGKPGIDNNSYYLYTGENYWTMSPNRFNPTTYVYNVSSSGKIYQTSTYNLYGIRPMISLKNSMTISDGDGSAGSPFIIE